MRKSIFNSKYDFNMQPCTMQATTIAPQFGLGSETVLICNKSYEQYHNWSVDCNNVVTGRYNGTSVGLETIT